MAACVLHTLVLFGAFKLVEVLGVTSDSNMTMLVAFGIYFVAVLYLHDAIEADYRQKDH